MPRKLTKDDVEALRALLAGYREQTISVGGATTGARFDASAVVRRAMEAIRTLEAHLTKSKR